MTRRMGGRGAAREPEMGLRLYGVLSAVHGDPSARDGGTARNGRRIGTPTGLAAVELLRVRDLLAAVAPAPFVAEPATPADQDATHAVVATLFAERAILPAPPGAVFRSREAIAAWLELHAAALAEALRYLEDRLEARVHVDRGPAAAATTAAAAAGPPETLHALRAEAVAMLVLREGNPEEPRLPELEAVPAPDAQAPAIAQAAFLVERARWGAFAAAVAREQAAHPDLDLVLTGPWPPYDFVRLELEP